MWILSCMVLQSASEVMLHCQETDLYVVELLFIWKQPGLRESA